MHVVVFARIFVKYIVLYDQKKMGKNMSAIRFHLPGYEVEDSLSSPIISLVSRHPVYSSYLPIPGT